MHLKLEHLFQDLEARIHSLSTDTSMLDSSRNVVEQALHSKAAHYGINTGFGILANKRVPSDALSALQTNLILSHSVGVGEAVPRAISKLMLGLKIHSLSLGYSGVSDSTFRQLIHFFIADGIPVIPSKGSVGASGDLAPLAHMSAPLLGLGSVWIDEKTQISAREFLQRKNIEAIALQAKDGLSLINGTQFMLAYGAFVAHHGLRLVKTADVLAAMSLEALQGSLVPFDERIVQVRPQRGAGDVSANVRRLLENSQILESHRHCGKVQDPYSLRCVPQVHGASRHALYHACEVFETEMNSVTDNPLVFENGDILSGGNFHGQPLALVMDYLAIALAELASISERRIYLLLAGHDGLPKLLMKNTGINSGFMIPQYTAAALVSENKVLCHPASVDSIPTSLGQEDHVSMGSISATKLYQVFENLRHVLSIELLTAAQALDFRKPLRPGRGVEWAHKFVRKELPHAEEDHFFQPDLHTCKRLIDGHELEVLLAEKGIELK